MPSLDVQRARALTPGCAHVVHLNHAGASLMPQPVVDVMVEHLQLEATIGGYEAAEAASEALEATYASIAALIGADPDEIALVDSATTAWNAAVASLQVEADQQILCTRSEYGSNAITLLQLRERTGCRIVLIDDDPTGQVDLDAFAAALQAGPVAFASLVHIPTGSGLVNPAEAVGSLCADAGVPLVLDACQSVGQLPVDVGTIGCSILTASSRKFLRGPRGTGFLYVRRSLLDRLRPQSLDLRSASWTDPEHYEPRADTRKFEQYDSVVAARLGMGRAVDHALEWGLPAIAERIAVLTGHLREGLRTVPGVEIHDKGTRASAITTCTLADIPATEVRQRLRAERINTSVVLLGQAQHDLPHRHLGDLLRLSVHYTTTDAELDQTVDALRTIGRTG